MCVVPGGASSFERFATAIALVSAVTILQGLRYESSAHEPVKPAAVPMRLELPGIENAFRLTSGLYSGGDPTEKRSFEALRALGVKTMISVDGARPDVEAARRSGIRYVHIPVGYDGVTREQALRIIRAVETLPGPRFIHCHHGKHRGPTAAALCGIATEHWSKDEALSWMKRAGTSPDYRGLFATVEAFTAPTADELSHVDPDFPERAKVPGIVEAMVQVDKRWDQLKTVREAGFTSPPAQPDLDPSHEALQLEELFRELGRQNDVTTRGEDFIRMMGRAEHDAAALRAALRDGGGRPSANAAQAAETAFAAMAKRCTSCHARYRDN